MKITVYNDTDKDWVIHASSEKGTNGEQRIPRQNMVNFEVSEPHTREVFIKVWGDTVLVHVSPDLRSRLAMPLPRASNTMSPPEPRARTLHYTHWMPV